MPMAYPWGQFEEEKSMAPLHSYLSQSPLIAILRGVRPDEVVAIGQALYDEGLRCIEVPLNSPEPLKSIEKLVQSLPKDCLIGAGTVMKPELVKSVQSVGGQLIVMPHSDAKVIVAAKEAGLICAPGVATPTEAFAALDHGADALKLFPAEQLDPAILKAWRAVVPKDVICIPVGGISPERMAVYWKAGASGFGLGSAIYKPGQTAAETTEKARAFMVAVKGLSV